MLLTMLSTTPSPQEDTTALYPTPHPYPIHERNTQTHGMKPHSEERSAPCSLLSPGGVLQVELREFRLYGANTQRAKKDRTPE